MSVGRFIFWFISGEAPNFSNILLRGSLGILSKMSWKDWDLALYLAYANYINNDVFFLTLLLKYKDLLLFGVSIIR